MTREAAEKSLLEAFALRDRGEHPSLDLVSYVNIQPDKLEFRSSATGEVVTCVPRQMGKPEYVATLLTRVGQVTLTGCSRDLIVFFWVDKDAKSFIAAVEALRR
jgi:hypothetical protein